MAYFLLWIEKAACTFHTMQAAFLHKTQTAPTINLGMTKQRRVMRIFKYKHFAKFAEKQNISDADLRQAVERAESGLIDADLGGGVIKQRIARQGQGKSSGYRSIILFKRGNRAFFVHGFAKNNRANITVQELLDYKALSAKMLQYTDKEIEALLNQAIFMELHDE